MRKSRKSKHQKRSPKEELAQVLESPPKPKGEDTLEAKQLTDQLEERILGKVTPVELVNPFETSVEGGSASPPSEKPKPDAEPLPPTTPPLKLMSVDADCPWNDTIMAEVREIQSLFQRAERNTIKKFWGFMSAEQLVRWNELDSETQHRTVGAVTRQFADDNLIASWISYLSALPHPPAILRKFKMLIMVFGMHALTEESARHEYKEAAALVH